MVTYFLLLLGLALAASLLWARLVVHGVLALLGVVVVLAFVYFGLGAQAAGAAQLMVYAGGVMVLLLFGVMTTAELDKEKGPLSKPSEWISGFGLAGVLFFVLGKVFLPALQGLVAVPKVEAFIGGSLEAAGTELLTNHAAPFEFAAFLLLLALAGAAPLAAGLGPKKGAEEKPNK